MTQMVSLREAKRARSCSLSLAVALRSGIASSIGCLRLDSAVFVMCGSLAQRDKRYFRGFLLDNFNHVNRRVMALTLPQHVLFRGTNMRVLVTGGAGFIGSHLVEYHLARGDTVMATDDIS